MRNHRGSVIEKQSNEENAPHLENVIPECGASDFKPFQLFFVVFYNFPVGVDYKKLFL